MSASTKLSTAVKALCFLGNEPLQPRNSKDISNHIGVNASKLRKILSMLVKNEILKSEQGANGGFVFNKDTNQIHLQEIYCAIEDRKAFHLDVNKEKADSNHQNNLLNQYFLNLFAELQIDIEDKMRRISLQSVIDFLNNQ